MGGWGGDATTCTNEDSSAGRPRAHLHLKSRIGWRMDYGQEGRRGGSGEVHGPQGVVVDLNGFGQRLRIPAVALTGHVAALGTETRSHELQRMNKKKKIKN